MFGKAGGSPLIKHRESRQATAGETVIEAKVGEIALRTGVISDF
jgi:hypothetical protein